MPRITLIVTDEQLHTLKHKAGLIPLSRWIRSVILASAGGQPTASNMRDAEDGVARVPAVAPPKAKGRHFTDTW
jgi:hypothetical protein